MPFKFEYSRVSLGGFALLAGNTLFRFTAGPKIGKRVTVIQDKFSGKFLSTVYIKLHDHSTGCKKEDNHTYKTGCR